MLEINNLSVRFGGLNALKQVSLNVNAQEIVGLIGPNGAGKTTLFNAISGLVKPVSGTLTFKRQSMLKMRQHKRARLGIGRTFQIPQPMHELSVRQNLQVAQHFGARCNNPKLIDEILEVTHLKDKQHCLAASELALTELKALELAKALATQAELLLLDEVLAGLESHNKRQFEQMLKELQQQFSVAMLIIEHDINTIYQLCQRVVVLNFGELIANASAQEVFSNPTVIKSYTGGDYATNP